VGVIPHLAQNINAHRGSNIDARTTRHEGYRARWVIRKRIEEGKRKTRAKTCFFSSPLENKVCSR